MTDVRNVRCGRMKFTQRPYHRKGAPKRRRLTLLGTHSTVSRRFPSWSAGRCGCSTQTSSIAQKKRGRSALQVIDQIEQVLSERVAVPLRRGGQLQPAVQPAQRAPQRVARQSCDVLSMCVPEDSCVIAHAVLQIKGACAPVCQSSMNSSAAALSRSRAL